MLFDCLCVVVDVFGLNTGNTGDAFFKILNGANILPRQPSCQSLEIWQVVHQVNQPPEPEEPQEP